MKKLLLVEDEKVIRTALRVYLSKKDFEVAEADSVENATQMYDLEDFDLVITDLRLPGVDGTEIIEKCSNTPVLVMTSYSSVKSAVESMQKGAVDYLAKPFDHEELLHSINRILSEQQTQRSNTALRSDIQRKYPFKKIIGTSPSMQNIFSMIEKVAPTSAMVLILGESGTGKELVARALHDTSPRSKEPLVIVNCAAIPETLVESELFGHEKGAFTGANARRKGMVEEAESGTLFLDEIGELPLHAQARLLRVLQNGEVRRLGSSESRNIDVRIIAATHRNLKELVETGKFREDLYFRLNVVEISLPPIRERGDDLIALAEEFLQKSCENTHKTTLKLSEEAINKIKEYHWPGNVRELENAIERAVILNEGTEIPASLFDIPTMTQTESINGSAQFDMSLDEYFHAFILEHQQSYSETEIAKRLGISRKSLWERRKKLNIVRADAEN